MPGSDASFHSRFDVTLLLNEVLYDTTWAAGYVQSGLTDSVLAQLPGIAFISDLRTILDTWFNDAVTSL